MPLDLTLTSDRTWQETISDTGSFSVTFHNDDPALASVVSPNTAVNFYIGSTLAFTGLFESFEKTIVSQDEEAEQVTIWHGRGHSAVFDRALLFPSLGVGRLPIEEDRGFNIFSPTFDDSDLITASTIALVSDARTGGATEWGLGLAPWDPEFPDLTAEIIWGSYISPFPPGIAAPGKVYGRQWITTPFNGLHKLFVTADDNAEFYVDGALAGTASGNWTKLREYDVDLSAGTHLLAWVGTNIGTFGPAGVVWVLYFPNGFPPALVAHSDASLTLIADYPPDVPGMTPGAALLIVINEAQARGTIPYVVPLFDAVNDTFGNPWPVVPDIATKVGSSVLTFLKELSGTYIDWRLPPGTWNLEAYNIGTMTATPGIDYHSPTDPNDPTTGNLAEHHQTGET